MIKGNKLFQKLFDKSDTLRFFYASIICVKKDNIRNFFEISFPQRRAR